MDKCDTILLSFGSDFCSSWCKKHKVLKNLHQVYLSVQKHKIKNLFFVFKKNWHSFFLCGTIFVYVMVYNRGQSTKH